MFVGGASLICILEVPFGVAGFFNNAEGFP